LQKVFPKLKEMVEQGREYRKAYYDGITQQIEKSYYEDNGFEKNIAGYVRASYFYTLNRYREEQDKKNPFAEMQALQLTKEKFPEINADSYQHWDTNAQLFYKKKLKHLESERSLNTIHELPPKMFQEWKEAELARLNKAIRKNLEWSKSMETPSIEDIQNNYAREYRDHRYSIYNKIKNKLDLVKKDNLGLHAFLEEEEIKAANFNEDFKKQYLGSENRNDGAYTKIVHTHLDWLHDLAWWGFEKDSVYWGWKSLKDHYWYFFEKPPLLKLLDPELHKKNKLLLELEADRDAIFPKSMRRFFYGALAVSSYFGLELVNATLLEKPFESPLRTAAKYLHNRFISNARDSVSDEGIQSDALRRSDRRPSQNYEQGEGQGKNHNLFKIVPNKGQRLEELPTEFEKTNNLYGEYQLRHDYYDEYKGKVSDFTLSGFPTVKNVYGTLHLPYVKGYQAIVDTDSIHGYYTLTERDGHPFVVLHGMGDKFDLKINYYKISEPQENQIKEIADLSQYEIDNLKEVSVKLRAEGFKALSQKLLELSEKPKVTVQDIASAVSETSLYSFVKAKELERGPTFSRFREFLDPQGNFCGMCGPANELLLGILRSVLDNHKENFETRTVYLRDMHSNAITPDRAHSRVYVTLPGKKGYLVLDGTPYKMDLRNPNSAPKKNVIEKHEEQVQEAKELKVAKVKEAEEKAERRKEEWPMDYDHKFRWRGQLDLITHKDPDPTVEPEKPEEHTVEPEKANDEKPEIKPEVKKEEKPKPKNSLLPAKPEIKTEDRIIEPTPEEIEAEILRRAQKMLEERKRRNIQRIAQLESLAPFKKIIADNLKALKPRKISEGTGVPHQLVADIVNLLESFVYNKINESELLNRLQRFQEKTLENPTLYMVLAGADKEIRKLVKKYQAKVEERIQQQKASQLHSRIMKDPLPYEKFVEPKLVQAALRLLDDVMKKHWSPMEKESMEDILSDLRKPHSCKEIFDQLTRKITVVVQ
jgi:hypothetical protein